MRGRGAWVSATFLAAPLLAGEWTAVRIVPADIVLARPGEIQQFLVLARTAEGAEEEVSAQARIISSTPEIVVVDRTRNAFTGARQGQCEIRAEFAGLHSSVSVKVGDQPSEVGVRFSPDVLSVLTIKGCNSSGCHGSPAGQNGFKLSLFGYDGAADYDMILHKHDGRRVDLAKVDRSLILRKPLFEVPHGGGRLLTRDSEEYKTLRKWLEQGAKFDSTGPRLLRLEMYPPEQVIAGKGTHRRLVVMGRLSDGTTRDMTREVRYTTNDETVASVDRDGNLTAGTSGLSTVLARGMGNVAAAQVGVIRERGAGDFPKPVVRNFIDELVYAKQRRLNVPPAPLATDRELIRRAYLDTIGTLPTPEEVERYVSDQRPGKQGRLMDALLERPEYAEFWTVKFEDWFRNNQLNSQGRSMGKFKEWILDWLREDRPYDQTVREILSSQGDTFQQPATNFWHPATDFMLKKFDVKKATPTVSRLFLGIRLECAECHNHPLENFTQDDFYGLSAFFARMRVKHGTAEYRRTWYLDEEGEVDHPLTQKPVPAKFLGGGTPRFQPEEDRRVALARWVTASDNPYFARAIVNRIWHEYFQTGIVEPFDDFRSTNPPTNRELLDRLARYFIDSGYHLKALHRLILNSSTYQRSSRRAKEEGDTPVERLLFARYQPRKLTAEVLLDAISQVTSVPHPFKNYPQNTRAMDLYIPDAPDYFLVTFGFPRRDIICERAASPTLSQALHMINGDTITRKVEDKNNILAAWTNQAWNDQRIVEAIYRRAYGRQPSETESAAVAEYLREEQAKGSSRRRALEGVLWTVLNSMEFQVNY